MTLEGVSRKPSRPIMIVDRKIAVTPFPDRLRVAGTLELVDQDFSISVSRLRGIHSGVHEYLDLGRDAALLQPADQALARCGPAVQPGPCEETGEEQQDQNRDDGDPATRTASIWWRAACSCRGHEDMSGSRGRRVARNGTASGLNAVKVSQCETAVAATPQ
jgi:hypothetical protein